MTTHEIDLARALMHSMPGATMTQLLQQVNEQALEEQQAADRRDQRDAYYRRKQDREDRDHWGVMMDVFGMDAEACEANLTG